MHLLDISYLQAQNADRSETHIRQLCEIVNAQHQAGQPITLLLLKADHLTSLRLRLRKHLSGHASDAIQCLDLPSLPQATMSQLLARFMVQHQVIRWTTPAHINSLIPQSGLQSAAAAAVVTLDVVNVFAGLGSNGVLLEPLAAVLPPAALVAEGVTKPSLAIVAPYPPDRSGIADYVAQQVDDLKAHYRLYLVRHESAASETPIHFPGEIVSHAQFLKRPDLHHRVLYHIGNSPAHLPALALLKQISGLVVCHDFFLGDIHQYNDIILHGKTQADLAPLIHAHGFGPLIHKAEAGQPIRITDYPCNLRPIEQARQCLVHSDYVLRQAIAYYGPAIQHKIRQIGFAKALRLPADRTAAKVALGYQADHFLVATFGFATPAKNLETLIHAWQTSDLAHRSDATLLIVGEFLDTTYQTRIERLLGLRPCANIQYLGYVSPTQYLHYLDAVDLAVQLRTQSRGETSAALLDCMASGIPVIVNNHGFVEDLPENALWKTPAQPDVSELCAALEHLHAMPMLRRDLVQNAADYLRQHSAPKDVAQALMQAIEATAAQGCCPTLAEISQSLNDAAPTENPAQYLRLAQALDWNTPAPYHRQLLFDITAVARFDLRTGIQRVVRALLREFQLDEPSGYRVLPVYLDHDGQYHYANRFMAASLGIANDDLVDELVDVNAGDLYFAVDLHTTSTVWHAPIYDAWRQRGVQIISVLYDLLPIRSPQWFPAMVEPDFTAWARHIASNSDGVLAISRTVAEDFADWVREQDIDQARAIPLNIGWFHLGSDLAASVPSQGLPDDAREVLQKLESVPSFLMVGTIEPRKGHAQTLAAFDVLWAQGSSINLVIVGKEGWHMEDTAERLRHHPLLGQRLFWLEAISDEYLEQVYPRCTALIAASEGEGFGLPLIEAARHHIPVIARDIPVFREVGGDGAAYFQAEQPVQLAEHIQAWINTPQAARPDPQRIVCLNWQESAAQAKDFVINGARALRRIG